MPIQQDVLINWSPQETRVAIVENGAVQELHVERALELEFARHCAVHDAGGTVVQETMLFDAAADRVRAARSKEGSHDYRYFPEPDLPPLVLSEAFVQGIQYALPEFPAARRARYASSFGLGAADVEVLTATRAVGDWFEAVVARCGDVLLHRFRIRCVASREPARVRAEAAVQAR